MYIISHDDVLMVLMKHSNRSLSSTSIENGNSCQIWNQMQHNIFAIICDFNAAKGKIYNTTLQYNNTKGNTNESEVLLI